MPRSTDIVIQEMAFDTNATGNDPAMIIEVDRLTAMFTNAWLEKMVKFGIGKGADRLPVEVTYEGSQFTPTGAEVSLKAGSGFLKASATISLEVAGAGPDKLMIRVAEVRAGGMLPVDNILGPFIEKAINQACEKPGIDRHPTEPRAVLVDPNVLLQSQGVPVHVGNGGYWQTSGNADGMVLTFACS